jgi:hypothetical protein
LLKQQAQAGDIVLLCEDESEALTHPYLAHAWAKRGADLRIEAPGQARKVAMFGGGDVAQRRVIVMTAATKRSSDFIALLERLERLYGPRPGRATKPVVLVARQWPHPHQQGQRGRPRRTPLAQGRMAGQIRAGTQ